MSLTLTLNLYYHPLVSCCHKVLIALYEHGTAARTVANMALTRKHGAEFMRVDLCRGCALPVECPDGCLFQRKNQALTQCGSGCVESLERWPVGRILKTPGGWPGGSKRAGEFR